MAVEYSPQQRSPGTDLYLCGARGFILAQRTRGMSLGYGHCLCPNCGTLNERTGS